MQFIHMITQSIRMSLLIIPEWIENMYTRLLITLIIPFGVL